MAKTQRYSQKTYQVYGYIPVGNHKLQVAMGNDRGLYNYVKKNNKTLSRLPKGDAIKLIKSHASENWAKEDLKVVKGSNTKAKNLRDYLKYFND